MIDEVKLLEYIGELDTEMAKRATPVDRNSQIWYKGYIEALHDIKRRVVELKIPASPSKKA